MTVLNGTINRSKNTLEVKNKLKPENVKRILLVATTLLLVVFLFNTAYASDGATATRGVSLSPLPEEVLDTLSITIFDSVTVNNTDFAWGLPMLHPEGESDRETVTLSSPPRSP